MRKELEALRKQLGKLQKEQNDVNWEEIKATMLRMDRVLYREEMLWLQRSCIMWLKEGNRNTKYFHQKSVWRARKNRI